MKKLLIISLLAISCAAVASAQAPSGSDAAWTLDDCIAWALDNNIQVKTSALTVDQQEVSLNTARNSMLPGVSFSTSQNFSFGRGLTQYNTYANTNTTSTSFSLGANMPLFQGLKIKNNIELGKLNLSSAVEDLEKIKNSVRTSVAAAYVQVLYNREILEVAQRQVDIDSVQVARLEAMALNGKASSAEVASQKATLARSRSTAVEASNNLSLSTLELTQLLEIPSPEGFSVAVPSADELGIKLPESPDAIYETALGIKPEIKSEQIKLDAAETSIKLAKGDYYPTLSLSGGLGSNFYTNSLSESQTFFDQLSTNFSQYIGLSLNVPIFQKLSVRNSVRSAKISYNTQLYQLESAKKTLYKEIQQAYYNAVAAGSSYASSTEAAASAREAFELMKAKYENGKANITEFNASKTQYLEAESNLSQARWKYLYQSKLLDFYKGEKLTF